MSILSELRKGRVPVVVARAAENMPVDRLVELLLNGHAAVPANEAVRHERPCALGPGLRTKVNANIGSSGTHPSLSAELVKLTAALEAGADTVMDLSTGGDISALRRALRARCPVPLGTVPVYEAAVRAQEERGSLAALTPELLFAVVQAQAEDGVDFMTLHCGVTAAVIETLRAHPRVTGIVSRGGALLAGWMLANGQENPLFEQFDRLLEICRRHEVTISLGDGLRPGSLADAGDAAQMAELDVLGDLVLRAREADVQVIVEGPGHMLLHQVEAQMHEAKRRCHDAPLYVLGPLVTDVAAGHDHIAAAIGGALAAAAGADFLCYVTPREHLGLPDTDDVREGVIAARVAAHAADLARGVPGAESWDLAMSRARKALDWERQLDLALDSVAARRLHEPADDKVAGNERGAAASDQRQACSMCGDLCALKVLADHLGDGADVLCG